MHTYIQEEKIHLRYKTRHVKRANLQNACFMVFHRINKNLCTRHTLYVVSIPKYVPFGSTPFQVWPFKIAVNAYVLVE